MAFSRSNMGIITIKFYRYSAIHFTVSYRDKQDLFSAFQKKLKELSLPIERLWWNDFENDRCLIENADDLFAAVQYTTFNSSVKIFYHVTDKNCFEFPSTDDEKEDGKETCKENPEAKETEGHHSCTTSNPYLCSCSRPVPCPCASTAGLHIPFPCYPIPSAFAGFHNHPCPFTAPEDKAKTATFKFCRDDVPHISLCYKNNKDLFENFLKKIEKLGLRPEQLYWSDWDNNRHVIKTANNLMAAIRRNGNGLKLFYLFDDNHELLVPAGCEEELDDDLEEDDEDGNGTGIPSQVPAGSCYSRRVQTQSWTFPPSMPMTQAGPVPPVSPVAPSSVNS